jgi:hypothetical protein
MSKSLPRAVPRAALRGLRVLWWVLVGVGLVVRLLGRGLVRVGRVLGFVAEPVDELVTAWLGTAPVLPRIRRWARHVRTEWLAYRAGAIEAEVLDGVWR